MERQHTGSRLGRRSRKRKRRKICDQSDRIVSCAHDLGHINLQKWMTNQNGFKNNLVPALFPGKKLEPQGILSFFSFPTIYII
jgi:hypothetical protein